MQGWNEVFILSQHEFLENAECRIEKKKEVNKLWDNVLFIK